MNIVEKAAAATVLIGAEILSAGACAPAGAEGPTNPNIPQQTSQRTETSKAELSNMPPEIAAAKRYLDAFFSGDINQVLSNMDPGAASQTRANAASMRNIQASIDLLGQCRSVQYVSANIANTGNDKFITFTTTPCEISISGGKITIRHFGILENSSSGRPYGSPTTTP